MKKISWVAVFFSAGLHAMALIIFSQHPPAKKTKVVEELDLSQMLMMPDLKDPEEEKIKELDDPENELVISVPALADIPVLVAVDASFTQELNLAIPAKLDGKAGQLMAVPAHNPRSRPDDSAIKNLFNPGDLDKVPEPLTRIAPEYPPGFKSEVKQAHVRVGFIVNSTGNVVMPYIISSTHKEFERPAMDAVLQWKFRPGMKNGRKVNTRAEQMFNFDAEG